jgi:Domain of unknown function (DUF4157)
LSFQLCANETWGHPDTGIRMSALQAKTKPKAKRAHRSPQVASQNGNSGVHDVSRSTNASLGTFYAAGPVFGLGGLAQTNLAIGRSQGAYEREADAVADQVSSGHQGPSITGISPGGLASIAQRQEMEEDEESVQTQVVQRQAMAEEEPEQMPVQPLRVQRQAEEEEPEEEMVQSQSGQRQMTAEEGAEAESVRPKFIQRQAEGQELSANSVQTQLIIGVPDDKYEREADRMADGVMRKSLAPTPDDEDTALQAKPVTQLTPLAGPQVQTQCAAWEAEERIQAKTAFPPIPDATKQAPKAGAAGETGSGRKEEVGSAPAEKAAEAAKEKGATDKVDLPAVEPFSPEEEMPPIQTQRAGSRAQTSNPPAAQRQNRAVLQNTLRNSKGRGSPMAPTVQSEMEQHFGKDFSQVRVHTDSTAVQMNQDLRSRAFTNGKDIYFNAGEYEPASQSGRLLLAHELTHTVQQGAVDDMVQRFSAPEQDVTVEPKPARPDDGAEVTGRVNDKIANDEDVQNQDDLDEEEREEKKKPDRGEVRQESGEIKSSGETEPSVDRGAQAEEITTAQKEQLQQDLQQQPAEATEQGEGKA